MPLACTTSSSSVASVILARGAASMGFLVPALAVDRAGRVVGAQEGALPQRVRRAERAGWAAWAEHEDTMTLLAITYLNRLSDLVFILARYANRANGDVLWVPGGERDK